MAYCAPRGIPLSEFLAWAAADQDAAMAWMQQEARRCRGCGTDPEDWTTGDAYHAEIYHCDGCMKRASAQAEADKKQSKGWLVRLARGPAPTKKQ